MSRKAAWLIMLLVVAFAVPLRVLSDTSTSVTNVVVGRAAAGVERLTLRFSAPMIALGQQTIPLTMACAAPGEGRWADPQTYVWTFARPLPAGLSCAATLTDGLKDAAGREVTGTRRFPLDSGGPAVLAILPEGSGTQIEEDQAFLVAANGPGGPPPRGAGGAWGGGGRSSPGDPRRRARPRRPPGPTTTTCGMP